MLPRDSSTGLQAAMLMHSTEVTDELGDVDENVDNANEPLLPGDDHGNGTNDDEGDTSSWLQLRDTTIPDSVQGPLDYKESDSSIGVQSFLSSPYVFFCAIFSALGGFIFGIDQGIVSIILVMPHFLERFPEVSESAPGAGFLKGLLTAMIEVGALIGALSQGCIADRVSRKYSIVISAIIFVVGSTLQTAAVDYAMLASARFIGGIGVGMLSMVVPLYISEISPPQMRGSLLVLEELSIVTGIVIAFWITYMTQHIESDWSWRLPFLLQIVPGAILGIGILSLPFSPRWLVAQGRDRDALQSLSTLRQRRTDNPQVLQEWLEIRTEVQFHNDVSSERHPDLQQPSFVATVKLEIAGFTDCFARDCIRRTHVGVGLMFFQQFVGINALIYYSPSLFKYLGLDSNMQLIMSGILNCIQLVGVVTSLFTIDRIGRRPLLLAGSFLMFLSHFVIAILVRRFSHDWPGHPMEGWVCVSCLMLFMFIFGSSWGPCPWAIPSEIFPSSLRGKGVALSTSSNWINNAIIGIITPPLIQNTNEGAYAFFAIFCLLSFIWTYLFVPETNGKSLEQMDDVFGDKMAEVDHARKSAIRTKLKHANAGLSSNTRPP